LNFSSRLTPPLPHFPFILGQSTAFLDFLDETMNLDEAGAASGFEAESLSERPFVWSIKLSR
jgi:hypothetical protein